MSISFRVITGFEAGRSFTLMDGERATIGRQRPCDILLSDEMVSRKHAILEIKEGKPYLTDLGSRNGCFIDGYLVSRSTPNVIRDYFVIGGTVLRAVQKEPEFQHDAWSINATELEALNRLPFFKEAVQISAQYPYLHTGHLLYGLLVAHGNMLQKNLNAIGSDVTPSSLKKRLNEDKIFTGDRAWLNRCIAHMRSFTKPAYMLVTPKAKSQIMALNENDPNWPEKMLYRLLDDFYNLGVIALDLPATLEKDVVLSQLNEPSIRMDVIPEIAEPKAKSKQDDITWPAKMQDRLQGFMGDAPQLILTGSKGSGKSHLLRAYARSRRGHYHDLRAFFYFAQPKEELEKFLGKLMGLLQRSRLVVIDHLDYFLDHGDVGGGIFKVLAECKAPNILVVSGKNLDRIKKLCPAAVSMNLDDLIKPELENCYRNLFSRFQQRTGFELSSGSRRLVEEKVIARDPFNLAGLWEFFSVAHESLKEMGSLPSVKEGLTLDKAFFNQVLRHWAPSGTQPGVGKDTDVVGGLHERSILKKVEQLVHQCSRDLWKVEMEYSDGSKSFDEKIHLTREQKLEELGRHLAFVFTLPQAGFQQWFMKYIDKLEPGNIEQDVGSVRQYKQLWQMYRQRMENMTPDLAQDLYNRLCGEILEKEMYQNPAPMTKDFNGFNDV